MVKVKSRLIYFCFPKIMIAFHVLLERMDRYSSDLHEYLIVTGLEHVHFGNLESCFQVIINVFWISLESVNEFSPLCTDLIYTFKFVEMNIFGLFDLICKVTK